MATLDSLIEQYGNIIFEALSRKYWSRCTILPLSDGTFAVFDRAFELVTITDNITNEVILAVPEIAARRDPEPKPAVPTDLLNLLGLS